MSEESIEILLKIGNRFYEGKLTPQKIGGKVPLLDSKRPILPELYNEMVTISDQGDHWEIRPRQFLGSEAFSAIASAVRGMNGEYVSAGKSSHFRVPK